MKPKSMCLRWWQWKSVGPGFAATKSTSSVLLGGNDDNVLSGAGDRFSAEARHLEGVPVKMDQVYVRGSLRPQLAFGW
jgi:hypothetical protein